MIYIEIVPNNPGNALKFYKLKRDAQGILKKISML